MTDKKIKIRLEKALLHLYFIKFIYGI